MEENNSKKSYYLPKKLMDFFAEECKPGRDYSPKVAAGILLYMAISPQLKEFAEKLAYSNDAVSAVQKIKTLLEQTILDTEVNSSLATLSSEQKALIVQAVKLTKSKTSPTYKMKGSS